MEDKILLRRCEAMRNGEGDNLVAQQSKKLKFKQMSF